MIGKKGAVAKAKQKMGNVSAIPFQTTNPVKTSKPVTTKQKAKPNFAKPKKG